IGPPYHQSRPARTGRRRRCRAWRDSLRPMGKPSACRAVAALLWALSASTVSAAPGAGARDAVIAAVRAQADRHVDQGAAMDTRLVLELYRQNDAGLPPRELADVYEAEYAARKAARQPTLRDRLVEILGLPALVIGLLLIFGKVIGEWL